MRDGLWLLVQNILIGELYPFGRNIVPVLREVPISFRLPVPAHVELFFNVDRVALALEPGGEPAAGEAAAGNGREIVEPVEQLQAGQALEHADRE
jgi:hypothetical protein